VELLKTQGNVSVLSSPRVSTINNQKAVIKVGSDEFFVTAISSNNTTNAAGATQVNPTVTLTPFFSGIALDVTPQISETGDITLHVHPSVSKVRDQTKELTVFGLETTLPLALSTSRESDSIVRAKSGQVVVIGGLMQSEGSDDQAGAPGLSDVPVLGYLFKQKRNSTKKSELVILLRPVVASDDRWEEQVRATRARFRDLDYPLDTSFNP
jgi:MSHA biogenesis protein MshL